MIFFFIYYGPLKMETMLNISCVHYMTVVTDVVIENLGPEIGVVV